MKTIYDWLDAYGDSHQNPINKVIHWICVPLIMLSLIGLIKMIPFPELLNLEKMNWAFLSWTKSEMKKSKLYKQIIRKYVFRNIRYN